jgi:hypothetical protein
MAVIRQKQQVFTKPIGVTRMNTGEAELWESVSRGAGAIQSLAFKENSRLAEQFGIDEAKKASLSAINPVTKQPESLEVPDGYGTIAQEAYKRVIEKRYTNSIQTEIEEQAASLAIKYPNPNSYDTQMSKYVQQMSESNPEYAGFIEDSGGLYLARTKTSLMKQAHVKARARAGAQISSDFDGLLSNVNELASSGSFDEAYAKIIEGVEDVTNGETAGVVPAGTASKSILAGRTAVAQGYLTHIYNKTSGPLGKLDRALISQYLTSNGQTDISDKYKADLDRLLDGDTPLLDYINVRNVMSMTDAFASDMSQVETAQQARRNAQNKRDIRRNYLDAQSDTNSLTSSFTVSLGEALSADDIDGVASSISVTGSNYEIYKTDIRNDFASGILNKEDLNLVDEARKSMLRPLVSVGALQGNAESFAAALITGESKDLAGLNKAQQTIVQSYRNSGLFNGDDAAFIKQVASQNKNSLREGVEKAKDAYKTFTIANEFSEVAINTIVTPNELQAAIAQIENRIGKSITATQALTHTSKMRRATAIGYVNNATIGLDSIGLIRLQRYIGSAGNNALGTTSTERAVGDAVLSVVDSDEEIRAIGSHLSQLTSDLTALEAEEEKVKKEAVLTEKVISGNGNSSIKSHRTVMDKHLAKLEIDLSKPDSMTREVYDLIATTIPQSLVDSLSAIANLQDVFNAEVYLQHYASLAQYPVIEGDAIRMVDRMIPALKPVVRNKLDTMIAITGRSGATFADAAKLFTERGSAESDRRLTSLFENDNGHRGYVLKKVNNNVSVAEDLYDVVELMARTGSDVSYIDDYIDNQLDTKFHPSTFIYELNSPVEKGNVTQFSLESILNKTGVAFEGESSEIINLINNQLGDGFYLNKTKKVMPTIYRDQLNLYVTGKETRPEGFDMKALVKKAKEEVELNEAQTPVYLVPHKYTGTDDPTFFAHVVSPRGELIPHILEINGEPVWPSFNLNEELEPYREAIADEAAASLVQDKVDLIEQADTIKRDRLSKEIQRRAGEVKPPPLSQFQMESLQ